MILDDKDLETMVCLLTHMVAEPSQCPINVDTAYGLRDKFEAELDHHTGPSRWAVYVDTVDTMKGA